jgi:hypothetical protein
MSNNQELNSVVNEVADPRLVHVFRLLNCESEDDISGSDYDKLEDSFISQAHSVVSTEVDLDALRAAGFTVLADNIAELERVSLAYDWSRENL